MTDCLWVPKSFNERDDDMSAPSRLGNRGERNRNKFRAVEIGAASRGPQQKASGQLLQYCDMLLLYAVLLSSCGLLCSTRQVC